RRAGYTSTPPNPENAKTTGRCLFPWDPTPAATSEGHGRDLLSPVRAGSGQYEPCHGPLDVGNEPPVYTAIYHCATSL
ncbi:MAG: hypothetical protein OXF41_11300, partial [bacterium]|nr:hypothetical protein [bacterium]